MLFSYCPRKQYGTQASSVKVTMAALSLPLFDDLSLSLVLTAAVAYAMPGFIAFKCLKYTSSP